MIKSFDHLQVPSPVSIGFCICKSGFGKSISSLFLEWLLISLLHYANKVGDIMITLKKRKCPECSETMHPKIINMVYKKEQCAMEIGVIGIPAYVCDKCHYRILPGKVAKYIDSLVDPIFQSQVNQTEEILPAPHVDIQFPALERASYCYN